MRARTEMNRIDGTMRTEKTNINRRMQGRSPASSHQINEINQKESEVRTVMGGIFGRRNHSSNYSTLNTKHSAFMRTAFMAVLAVFIVFYTMPALAASMVCTSDTTTYSYNDYWDYAMEGYSCDGCEGLPGSNPTVATHATTLLGHPDSDDNKAKFQDETTLWSDGTMAAETAGNKPKAEYQYQAGNKYKYSWTHVHYNADPSGISQFAMIWYFYQKKTISGTGSIIVQAYDNTDNSVDNTIDLDGAGNPYVIYTISPSASNCQGKDDKGITVSVDYAEFDLTPLMSRLAAAGYTTVDLRIMGVHDDATQPQLQFLTQEVELAVSTCTDPDPTTGVTVTPASGSTVGGTVTVQATIAGEGTPGSGSAKVTITGSTACNVTGAAMTWNAGKWEYSWNTSACGNPPENGITISVDYTDPDCGSVTTGSSNNITIDNACSETTPSSIIWNGTNTASGDFNGSAFINATDINAGTLMYKVTEGGGGGIVNKVGSWMNPTQTDCAGAGCNSVSSHTTGNYTPGAGTNRVVIIAAAVEDNGNDRISQVSYGGQVIGTAPGTGVIQDAQVNTGGGYTNTVWVGYCNETCIAAAGGGTITATAGPGNVDVITVSAGTYENVDQASPIYDSNNVTETDNNATITGTVNTADGNRVFYVNLNNGNGQTLTDPGTGFTNDYVYDTANSGFMHAVSDRNSTTAANPVSVTTTWSANGSRQIIVLASLQAAAGETLMIDWTSDPVPATGVLTDGNTYNLYARGQDTECGTMYYGDPSVPNTTADGVAQQFTWTSCTDPDPTTGVTVTPASGSTVGGTVTVQATIAGEGTPGSGSAKVTITGSTACNVSGAAMTWNAGKWEYSWNTSACGNPPENGITISVDYTDPDCGSVTNGTSNNITIDNTGPWTSITSCTDCHGQPPVDGTTRTRGTRGTGQVIGSHDIHVNTVGLACTDCHIDNGTNLNHRDGIIDFVTIRGGSYTTTDPDQTGGEPLQDIEDGSGLGNCVTTQCHGSASPIWGTDLSATPTCYKCHGTQANGNNAPPVDTNGDNAATDAQVGAHQAHLKATDNYSSPIACDECHIVPTNVGDAGHIDSALPAELTFGTLAKTNGANPSYAGGTCSNTYCHDETYFKNGWGSGTDPTWNDTTYLQGNSGDCNNCHGYPPSGGHPADSNCTSCHSHVNADNASFNDVTLHVNGTVEGGGECVTCHNGVPSGATYVTRDVVGSDFNQASRHVMGGTVTNWDCIVCHREGDESAATGGSVSTTTLHNNSGGIVVDLRNVDNPTTTVVQWDKNNITPAMEKGLDDFCLTCHDNNGASGIAVASTNDKVTLTPSNNEAMAPFNDTDGGYGALKASGPTGHTTRPNVVDVNSQFNPGTYTWPAGNGTMPGGFNGTNYNGNASQHAVRGPRYSTTNGSWNTWVNRTLKSGQNLSTSRETSQLHCADCHTVDQNAHGGANIFMLTAQGTSNTNSTIDKTCTQCHSANVYINGSGGRWDHRQERDVWGDGTASASDWDNSECLLCHGGGSGDFNGRMEQYGGIHGMNQNDPRGNNPPYRFMGGSYIYPNPNDNNSWNTTASNTACYGSSNANKWAKCNHHDGANGSKGWPYNFGRPTTY